jgi:hypothetical protein
MVQMCEHRIVRIGRQLPLHDQLELLISQVSRGRNQLRTQIVYLSCGIAQRDRARATLGARRHMVVGAQEVVRREDTAGKSAQLGVGQMCSHTLPFKEAETGLRLARGPRRPFTGNPMSPIRFISRFRAAIRRLITCCLVHPSC